MSRARGEAAKGAIRPSDDVRAMFDRIVPRYDLMNRLMTGGRDAAWRRLVVREAVRGREAASLEVLDVATGTGEIAIALHRAGVGRVTGLDFSASMLAEARRKGVPLRRYDTSEAIAESSVSGAIQWVEGDAMALPINDASFDAVTVGFGLRNMPSYPGALREMERVIRPGGKLVCLETTMLPIPALRSVFGWYFTRVVPLVGGLLSGDRDAYAYLPASAATFPDAEVLGRMMLDAGFARVRYLRLGVGTVAMHVATKAMTG